MGILRRAAERFGDNWSEQRHYFDLGCEVLGYPDGGFWRCTLMERADRVAAGRREYKRRQGFAKPTRPDGYYSTDRGYGAADYFLNADGNITSERPHVHVAHNPREGRIIFTVTQSDGTHTHQEYLPIDASGNEVNAVQYRLCRHLK